MPFRHINKGPLPLKVLPSSNQYDINDSQNNLIKPNKNATDTTNILTYKNYKISVSSEELNI